MQRCAATWRRPIRAVPDSRHVAARRGRRCSATARRLARRSRGGAPGCSPRQKRPPAGTRAAWPTHQRLPPAQARTARGGHTPPSNVKPKASKQGVCSSRDRARATSCAPSDPQPIGCRCCLTARVMSCAALWAHRRTEQQPVRANPSVRSREAIQLAPDVGPGVGLSEDHAGAAGRLRRAVEKASCMVGGSDRFDLGWMQL